MRRANDNEARSRGARALRGLFTLVLAIFAAALPARAHAAPGPVYSIVIGENAVAPALQAQARGLVTLRYADDDAFKVFSLLEHGSRQAFLLAVPDADTQRRFPQLHGRAVPPTLAELERVVAAVASAIAGDRARGEEPELVFFFSGHGVRDEHGSASLSLRDGALTRAWLYERLLATVPARFVHLVIDSCHAEGLVRPRDANATMETLDESERASYVDAASLDRFPHVGVVLASTSSAQSFEWDAYRGGVFAHQLLSGLRGGADVNGDGLVEYSELAAFLSAANLRVRDARARLQMVVRAPPLHRRVPLAVLGRFARQFELRGRAEGRWANGFFIETAGGERLVDVFPEQAARLALRLPVGQRLYLVRPDTEVEIEPQRGGSIVLSSLKARAPRMRARGSLDSALREGLFATRFGPAFYEGYVSQRDDLVAVPIFSEPPAPAAIPMPTPTADAPARRTGSTVATALLVGSGAAAIATGVLSGLTLETRSEYLAERYENRAHELRERFYSLRTAAAVTGGVMVALAGASLVLFVRPIKASGAPSLTTADGLAFSMKGRF
jgi:hypothetical protein